MKYRSELPVSSEGGVYADALELHRDELDAIEFEVMLELHERGEVQEVAEVCGVSVGDVRRVMNRCGIREDMPVRSYGGEKLTKHGRPVRKRLTDAALMGILMETAELSERDREVLGSMIGVRNQVMAASSLGLTLIAFEKEYRAIRSKHGF